LQHLAAEKLVESARDVAEGGIAVAVAKMVFTKGLGADVELIGGGLPAECVLFAEDATRALVTCDTQQVRAIEASAVNYGLRAQVVGQTMASHFTLRVDGLPVVEGEANSFRKVWREALVKALQSESEAAHV